MKYFAYKLLLNAMLRLPDLFFAILFQLVFPIYKVLHKKRAYGRTVEHLKKAEASKATPKNLSADDVFRGIYWNALDSYRGLARLNRTTSRIVFENEEIIREALARSKSPDGTPLPIAAISIHQGAFELLHRSLCRYSDNVQLITDSVGDKTVRRILQEFRSDPNLREYHPDELSLLLRNLFTAPEKIGKKGNPILAMVVDQGRHTKGNVVSLFGRQTTLYLRLPEKVNRMGAGIVTFRTFTRDAAHVPTGKLGQHSHSEIVIRFEKYYPPKYDLTKKECDATLIDCISHEIENWIAEHPAEWSWNYHGNFRVLL